jgi:hypothetical protein
MQAVGGAANLHNNALSAFDRHPEENPINPGVDNDETQRRGNDPPAGVA